MSTAAVVVNHDAGQALLDCVSSLRAEGIDEIVVVDNASSDGSTETLEAADAQVRVVRTGENLGYGAGANRGLALVGTDAVLVSNPDLVVHHGAVDALLAALLADDAVGVVGPRILETDGSRYPSARRFPSWVDAAGHVLVGALWRENPFTRRYRMTDLDATVPTPVDWVSGACFLARRAALARVGGFDERYFMYLEDVDLCWRLRGAGYEILYVPAATVTHVQGLSTSRRPYRMLVAHHRSALRFAARRMTGWRRLAVPAVAVALALRLAISTIRQLAGRLVVRLPGTARRAD
ncbi:MAG: glycosyltransferase family 2 protein [Acidimicrobiales bacterium]